MKLHEQHMAALAAFEKWWKPQRIGLLANWSKKPCEEIYFAAYRTSQLELFDAVIGFLEEEHELCPPSVCCLEIGALKDARAKLSAKI